MAELDPKSAISHAAGLALAPVYKHGPGLVRVWSGRVANELCHTEPRIDVGELDRIT